jgi:hypothetical protein
MTLTFFEEYSFEKWPTVGIYMIFPHNTGAMGYCEEGHTGKVPFS